MRRRVAVSGCGSVRHEAEEGKSLFFCGWVHKSDRNAAGRVQFNSPQAYSCRYNTAGKTS